MKKNLLKTLAIVVSLLINATAFAQCVIPITDGQSYTENFDSGTMECWTVEATGAGNWSIMTGTASNVVAFQNASAGDEARLISPTFDMSGIGSATFSFSYAMMSLTAMDVLTVSYRTSETDSWHEIQSYCIMDWTNYYEDSFDLPEVSSTYQISFLAHSNGGYFIFIDDIGIVGEGGCVRPMNLEATEITDTSALIGWSVTSGEESWDVEVDGHQITVENQPYLLENLESLTYYTIRVRANCGGGMQSDWSSPITFRTFCGVIIVTDYEPYFDDFEASDEFLCWQSEIISGEDGWVVDPGYLITNNSAFFIWLGEEAQLVSTILDISNVTTPTLSFRHKQPHDLDSADELSVWYRTSGTGTWAFLANYTGIIDEYMDETISLPNPTATYQIAFRAVSHMGSGVYVDDVRVGHGGDGVIEAQALSVAVSPNPTNGKITVNANVSKGNVIVFDMVGKQVALGNIVDGQAEIDLSEFANGVYFVKISDDNDMKTIKIVKR